MNTQELKDFVVTLGFSYSDFDVYEQPGVAVIIINKWVWWWKRKKIVQSVSHIRPAGVDGAKSYNRNHSCRRL